MLAASSLLAQGFSGRRESSTKHFVFVYEPRDQPTVTELRSFAEAVYAQVTGFLESYPKKIWVVVNGRVDTANGADFSLPSGIVLYITSPSVPILGFQEHEYLRMLLTHELTHYVQFNYDRGFYSVLSHILGSGVKPGDASFLPGWMIEGITTNTETLFTHGGRGRDPYFELQYKALVLDNHFFSLAQAGYGSAFPPRSRIYLGGYLMVHYLLQHYGEKTYTQIHQQYVKFPFFGPWAAIKKVTGRSAHEIYLDMLYDLRRKYAEYRKISPGRTVSPDSTGNYYLPVLTSNGWFEYRDTLDSGPAIVRFDPTTGRQVPIVHTLLTDYTSLTATADGKKLVFSTFNVTPSPAGTQYDAVLYALDPATGKVKRVTPHAHLWQPALSPDGGTLIAVQRVDSYSRLVAIDQKTGSVTPIFFEPYTNVFNPTFSPDGRHIAFTLNDHGTQRIYTIRSAELLGKPPRLGPAGSINRSLARPLPGAPASNAYFPHFHGNDAVTFSADLDGGLALYQTGIHDTRLIRVAVDPVGVASGRFDGSQIVYTTYSGRGYVVKVRPASTTLLPTAEAAAKTPDTNGTTTSTSILPSESQVGTSSRYTDWPRPLFWLPVPFYTYSGTATGSIPFGVGIYGLAASLLGRNQVGGFLTFRTDIFQPSVVLNLQSAVGKNTLSYALTEGYGAGSAGSYSQSLSQSLAFSIPLVSRYLMKTTTNLSLAPGVSDTLLVSRSQPFNFAEPFTASDLFSFQHGYSLDLGVSFSRRRSGGARDIFSPHNLRLSIQGKYAPPLLSNATSDLRGVFTGSVTVPSFAPHQVLKLGLKSSLTSTSAAHSPVVNPRGLFLPASTPTPVDEQTTPGRTVLSLGYLATIALADSPLPFGFNFQGLAAGFHIEAAADWSLSNAQLTPDPYLYAGLELISLVGYYGNSSPLPFGFGVSVRFDPTFRHRFNPLSDIGPYVFIGTDSFSSATTSIGSFGAARSYLPASAGRPR